jgi:hypothetical protein
MVYMFVAVYIEGKYGGNWSVLFMLFAIFEIAFRLDKK